MIQRLLEYRRTCWQLFHLSRCGVRGARIAADSIRSCQCLQRKWELIGLMGLVRSLRARVVVEIGTYRGGTLRCWASVCPADTTFISLDLPGGPFGGGYSQDAATTFKHFLKPSQVLHCLRADSHLPKTKLALETLLAGRPVDFLFIDGDHSYEGVRSDYEMYGPLVRGDGVIALHDIVPHHTQPTCQVDRFWNEVKHSPEAREIVDRDGFDTWGGIGVLRKGVL